MSNYQIRKDVLRSQSLTVVGSGISGIMTAWRAVAAGMTVALYSKSPDPRSTGNPNCEHESSTFDSKVDQRYITIFEGHPYLDLAGYVDKMYPGIAEDFQREVAAGGLLAVPCESFSQRSIGWLKARSEINRKLRGHDQECVHAAQELFAAYAGENRSALAAWYGILASLLRSTPELLRTLSLNHKGIVRLYDQREVFEQAQCSHEVEGVLKHRLSLDELSETYPAYAEGVRCGFIQGGALEIYGLTFAVQALGKHLLGEMERAGVELHFDSEVQRIETNRSGAVTGVVVAGKPGMVTSNSYIFHTGAFAGPELYADVPAARDRLAAVEGYWITIKNADSLVGAMGNMPNKVHGKKSLADILSMVDARSAARFHRRFAELGVQDAHLSQIAPIIDFNNMPIHSGGKTQLGVGSGYIFKGLSERSQENGKVSFVKSVASEKFVLAVMELWLVALHGTKLLNGACQIVVHPRGCKRSWTPDDRELDVNLPTASGGVCMMHDGGNTGSTTKAPFIAEYALCKIAHAIAQSSLTQEEAEGIRASLRTFSRDFPPKSWQVFMDDLDAAVSAADNLLD